MTTTHLRAFTGDVEHHDGVVTGLLVPFDSPAWVRDVMPDGSFDDYQEGFRREAFDRMLTDPRAHAGRLAFKHMHEGGLGYMGTGTDIEARDDGLWGSFKIVTSRRADVADLMDAGVRGLSIEFNETPNGTVEEDGVRWRTNVRLSAVALEWRGAYSEAQVLAYRAENAELAAERAVEAELAAADADVAVRAAAERERLVEEAGRRARAMTELQEWLADQESKQLELSARFG